MVFQVGQQVGSYRILDEIAKGAYSYVYKATHVVLSNRIVALKLLHTTFLGSGDQQDLFFQEARILENLRHPHILAVIDVNTYEGYPYIVKEYAPNGSLRDRFRKRKDAQLPFGEALSILKQIGEALQFAHQRRIVHCDLKPENILFNAQDQALIADFDVARVLNTIRSQTQGIGGTPSYMAPEQFQGKVRLESDQYTLACMAYELFTGKRPFAGSDFETLKREHLYQQPLAPRQLEPELPLHIEQAILRAMDKKYTERFPDVAAFITALDPGNYLADADVQQAIHARQENRLILKDRSAKHTVADDIYYEPTVAMPDEPEVEETPRKRRSPVRKTTTKTSSERKGAAPDQEKRPRTTRTSTATRGKTTASAGKVDRDDDVKPASTTRKRTAPKKELPEKKTTTRKPASTSKPTTEKPRPVRKSQSESAEKKPPSRIKARPEGAASNITKRATPKPEPKDETPKTRKRPLPEGEAKKRSASADKPPTRSRSTAPEKKRMSRKSVDE